MQKTGKKNTNQNENMAQAVGVLDMDTLIATMPDNGVWRIEKTKTKEPGKKYLASWSDVTKAGVINLLQYGETAKEAMTRLVAEIRGPLTDIDDDD